MSTVLPGNRFQISGYWLGIYGINTLHHLLTGKMSTVLPGNAFQISGYWLGVYGITRLLIRCIWILCNTLLCHFGYFNSMLICLYS